MTGAQLLAIGCAVWMATIVTLVVAVIRAPEGWQDSDGFHFGHPLIPQIPEVNAEGDHRQRMSDDLPELGRVGVGAVDNHNRSDAA